MAYKASNLAYFTPSHSSTTLQFPARFPISGLFSPWPPLLGGTFGDNAAAFWRAGSLLNVEALEGKPAVALFCVHWLSDVRHEPPTSWPVLRQPIFYQALSELKRC